MAKGKPPGLIFYATHGVEVLRITGRFSRSKMRLLAPEDYLGCSFYLEGVEALDVDVYRLYIPNAVSGVGFSTVYMFNSDGLILS